MSTLEPDRKFSPPSNAARRRVIGALTTTAGAAALGVALPARWTRPLVDSIVVPLHAQASPTTFQTFSSTGGNLTIGETDGAIDPFPWSINVAGVVGTVAYIEVTLIDFQHTYPNDVDILLMGPGGQAVMLMSDVGGSDNVNNRNLTFSQFGEPIPDGELQTGTYRPTNGSGDGDGGGDNPGPPAPSGPYSTDLSVFAGLNPNGVWQLLIQDDYPSEDGGTITGWEIRIASY